MGRLTAGPKWWPQPFLLSLIFFFSIFETKGFDL
jgi:hypothetical protein